MEWPHWLVLGLDVIIQLLGASKGQIWKELMAAVHLFRMQMGVPIL